MATVLITGVAGFIGSNLARYLQNSGFRVWGIDNLSLGWKSNLPVDITLRVGSLEDPEIYSDLGRADFIVHLAGASSAPMFTTHVVECFENNVTGFIRLLEFARCSGVRRVVYASTSSVYGNVEPPLRESGSLDLPNFYAVSKYCMENIARMYQLQFGIEVVGLRFMSVYGPREDHKRNFANLVSQFIWAVEKGEAPVIYGDGSQTRDFTNVIDIAQAIERVLSYEGNLESTVFNVGTGCSTPVREVVELLQELMGMNVEGAYIPNPVRTGYVMQQVASIEKISRVLGYRPTVNLRTGIQEILTIRSRSGVNTSLPLVGVAV